MKQRKSVASVATSRLLQSSGETAFPSRINERNAISKLKAASKQKRKTRQHEAVQSDNPVPRIENPCVSDCSQIAIPPEPIEDLSISTSDGLLSGRRTSVPETAKRSDDLINRHAPIYPNFEDRMSSTPISESAYAVVASELAFYKRGYEKAREECRILGNQQRQIESLAQLPGHVTTVLNQQRRKLAIQEKKLEDRANLEQHFSLRALPNAVSNSDRLIDLFQHLKDRIATVLFIGGDEEYPIENLPRKSADLDGLLSIVFGADSVCKLEETPHTLPTSTSSELIQALTGASIYSWVFGAEFQTQMMRTTPLLEEYRSFLTTWCGHESLYDLDLAVHRTIIESESFKEDIIPKMSKMFRDRLTHALHPFFGKSLKRKAMKKLRSWLGAVFKLAVEVRAESLLSANHFELIWPIVGLAANRAEMEAISSNPIADGKVVKLPLFPGLRAFRKEKKMVKYRGFSKGTSTDLRQDYVVKALILR